MLAYLRRAPQFSRYQSPAGYDPFSGYYPNAPGPGALYAQRLRAATEARAAQAQTVAKARLMETQARSAQAHMRAYQTQQQVMASRRLAAAKAAGIAARQKEEQKKQMAAQAEARRLVNAQAGYAQKKAAAARLLAQEKQATSSRVGWESRLTWEAGKRAAAENRAAELKLQAEHAAAFAAIKAKTQAALDAATKQSRQGAAGKASAASLAVHKEAEMRSLTTQRRAMPLQVQLAPMQAAGPSVSRGMPVPAVAPGAAVVPAKKSKMSGLTWLAVGGLALELLKHLR